MVGAERGQVAERRAAVAVGHQQAAIAAAARGATAGPTRRSRAASDHVLPPSEDSHCSVSRVGLGCDCGSAPGCGRRRSRRRAVRDSSPLRRRRAPEGRRASAKLAVVGRFAHPHLRSRAPTVSCRRRAAVRRSKCDRAVRAVHRHAIRRRPRHAAVGRAQHPGAQQGSCAAASVARRFAACQRASRSAANPEAFSSTRLVGERSERRNQQRCLRAFPARRRRGRRWAYPSGLRGQLQVRPPSSDRINSTRPNGHTCVSRPPEHTAINSPFGAERHGGPSVSRTPAAAR